MRSWSSLVRFVVLALVWGSSFLWIKIALGGLAPVQIAVVRLALGTLVVAGLCALTRTGLPRGRGIWLRILVSALFGNAIPFTLFAVGERSVDSGVAGVLNATTPLWALLIALVIGIDRPGPLRVVGLLLGFAGTLVIFAPWQSSGLASWGALACLVAALSYAIGYTFIARQLVGRLSSASLAVAQLGLGTGLVAVAAPVAGGLAPVHLSAGPLVAVAFLGVCASGLALVVNNRLIADEGATGAASVGYLLPVVSVLLGAVALHEQLNARILVGMVVVLAGVALSRWRPRPATAPGHPDRPQTSLRSVAQRESS